MYIHTETCLKNQDKEAVSRGRSNQMKSQEFASSCLYPRCTILEVGRGPRFTPPPYQVLHTNGCKKLTQHISFTYGRAIEGVGW